MPEFQMIPANPSFGNQLGQALGGGLGQGFSQGLSQQMSQMFEERKNRKKLQNIMEFLGVSPQGSAKTSLEPQKNASKSGIQLSPEKLIAASIAFPEIGKPLASVFESQQADLHKQRSFESERANKFLDKVSAAAEGIPERKIAISSAKSAVQSNQMVPFGGDFWADVLHAPQLKSASGAQLATSAKTNLVGSLSKLGGGRPNQFIEEQIDKSFAKAGQTEEANMAQLMIAESVLDLDEKYADLTRELADKDYNELGYVRGDIDRRVQKEMKPYYEKRQQELAYDLQQNIERDIGLEKMSKLKHVPRGTPLTWEMGQVLLEKVGGDEAKAEKLAINLGYTIPSSEIYRRM